MNKRLRVAPDHPHCPASLFKPDRIKLGFFDAQRLPGGIMVLRYN
jgi:hypothetical protein